MDAAATHAEEAERRRRLRLQSRGRHRTRAEARGNRLHRQTLQPQDPARNRATKEGSVAGGERNARRVAEFGYFVDFSGLPLSETLSETLSNAHPHGLKVYDKALVLAAALMDPTPL